MTKKCPVCSEESINSKGKCKSCDFEMPAFAFLNEGDANKWYEDIVLPEKEKQDYHIKLENQIKEMQTLLDASRKNEEYLSQQLTKTQELPKNQKPTMTSKVLIPVCILSAISLLLTIILSINLLKTKQIQTQSLTTDNIKITPNIGNTISFGGFDWHVLDVQNGKALLLSEAIIERRTYHNGYDYTTWANCSLRSYLNGEFYNKFNSSDRARIAETRIITNNNPLYGKGGDSASIDRIFLLSIEEVLEYFGDSGQLLEENPNNKPLIDDQYNSARMAKDRSESVSWWWWWLRSPGYDRGIANVYGDGRIDIAGYSANNDLGGVRPALWLNL